MQDRTLELFEVREALLKVYLKVYVSYWDPVGDTR